MTDLATSEPATAETDTDSADVDAPLAEARFVERELGDDLFTRLSQHPRARKVLTAFAVFMVFMIAMPNLPSGPLSDGLSPLWKPATEAGLRQSWHVFSPNPRWMSLEVKAVVEHDDGSIELWRVPNFDPAIGSYREYRYRKWEERITSEAFEERFEATAEWIARQHERDGELPAKVMFVRRTRPHFNVDVPPPIDGEHFVEELYYTWERDA